MPYICPVFISGFTFIRNAVKFDYPIKEAILSVLPLVDEMVVALGNSEDETEALLMSIASPKLKIIPTVWDDTLRQGGRVLAVETDKALAAISPQATWAIYIQGDECLHEADYPVIRNALAFYQDRKDIDGLLLNYRHFYATYDYVADSFSRYRREIRIVRPQPNLVSYRDAQGFRLGDEKLNVALIPANVYHYGMVKHPKEQLEKQLFFHSLWHDEAWVKARYGELEEFKYESFDALERFTGKHPEVMNSRIAAMNWQVDGDPTKRRASLKIRFKQLVARLTGIRIGEYKNYRLVDVFRNNF